MSVSTVSAQIIKYKATDEIVACQNSLSSVAEGIDKGKGKSNLSFIEQVLTRSTQCIDALKSNQKMLVKSRDSLAKLLEQASNKSPGRENGPVKLYVRSDEGRDAFVARRSRLFGNGGSTNAIQKLGELGLKVGSKVDANQLIKTLGEVIQERKTAISAIQNDLDQMGPQVEILQEYTKNEELKIRNKELKIERKKAAEIKQHNDEVRAAKNRREGARIIYVSNEGAAAMNNFLRAKAGAFDGQELPKLPDLGGLMRYYRTADSEFSNSFSKERQTQVNMAMTLSMDSLAQAFENYLIMDAEPMPMEGYLYHGGRLSSQKLQLIESAFSTGDAIKFAGFTSASPNIETAREFTAQYSTLQHNQPIIFQMNPSGAHQVQNPTEIEGVYKRNAYFKVASYTMEGDQAVVRLEPTWDPRNPIIL
jgi:hypothetical protein